MILNEKYKKSRQKLQKPYTELSQLRLEGKQPTTFRTTSEKVVSPSGTPPHPGLAEYFKNQTIIEKAVEWADTHLKEYTLDNNKKAYRLYLHDKEGNTVVINKDYINETFSKNKRNRKLAKTMSLATMVEEWMPLAKIVRTGDGIHHSCNFLVFEATYLDVTIEAKARDHGAYSILHTMRIKKLENPPERTANAADMSGLTNFSPQN